MTGIVIVAFANIFVQPGAGLLGWMYVVLLAAAALAVTRVLMIWIDFRRKLG